LALDQIIELDDSDAAIDYLHGRVGEGDVVLVKGSRGMEMDRIVSVMEAAA
jgi:UDP-N-acetylmuramyl pentapeptide synthase